MGMNSTGQNNDKASYRIILLLVVGLAAFSSAMKELNQLQQLGLDASSLIAQWSATISPVEVPQPPAPMVVKTESCELKQSIPSVELPWLEKSEAPVLIKRASINKGDVIKVKKIRRIDIDPVHFEVSIPAVHVEEVKTRRNGSFRINTRDREMLLKTFNRSINLRIAG